MVQSNLDELKGSFRGRTLLLVSCGPSAVYWKQVRSSLPEDTVIGCVKQAIFMCGTDAALHFFNAFNCQRYFPYNRRTLKISVVDAKSPVHFNPADITFSLDPRTCENIDESVAVSGRYEDYTIDNAGLTKPWGPGIMYEAVIYLALHLGFQRVHTVGWDAVGESIEPSKPLIKIDHFYNTAKTKHCDPRVDYEWLSAKSWAYRTKNIFKHLVGCPYNHMPRVDSMGEIPVIVRSLPQFFLWVESHGVSINVHTILKSGAIDATVRERIIDLGLVNSHSR